MKFSAAGLSLVQAMEGCVLTAYQDVGGTWTIGFGHTGPDVHEGLVWTMEQADAALSADLASVFTSVCGLLNRQLGDNQVSALVSLTYNIGRVAFSGSSALAVINETPASQQPLHVPERIRLWNKIEVAGALQTSPGLLGRRWAECALWRTPDGAAVPDFGGIRDAAVAAYEAGAAFDLDPWLGGD